VWPFRRQTDSVRQGAKGAFLQDVGDKWFIGLVMADKPF
jgi:hypothetical protein